MSQLLRIDKDELIKGYIERLYKINAYPTLGVLYEEIFGERVLRIHPYVPSHINRIVAGLEGYFEPEDLIQHHTLYPFYTAFQGQDVQKSIYKKMLIDNGNAYKIIKYNEIPIPQCYRYCPVCVKEGLEEYGDFSWNRIHQITPICTEHGVWIQESTFPVKYRMDEYIKHWRQMNLSEMCKEAILENTFQSSLKKARQVSDLIEKIIHQDLAKGIDVVQLKEAYLIKLKDKGLIYPSGKSIRITELIQQVEDYFTKELLQRMRVDAEKCVTQTVNNFAETIHPLYHIIMITFLNIDITRDLPKVDNILPDIPFYCLNPLNNHEANHIIDDIKVHYCYITKQHMCTFSCSCGFTFTTRIEEVIKSKGNKIGKIKAFGKVYEENLLRLRHLGIKGIARKTGINHGTIRRQLRNFEQYATINLPKKLIEKVRDVEDEVAITIVGNDRLKSEWGKKDKCYCELIVCAIEEELKGARRPRRITRTRIAKDIGAIHALVYNINKMPLSNKIIEEYQETMEVYYKRKIRWAIKMMSERGELLLEWKILKQVGCCDGNRDRVKQLIKEML